MKAHWLFISFRLVVIQLRSWIALEIHPRFFSSTETPMKAECGMREKSNDKMEETDRAMIRCVHHLSTTSVYWKGWLHANQSLVNVLPTLRLFFDHFLLKWNNHINWCNSLDDRVRYHERDWGEIQPDLLICYPVYFRPITSLPPLFKQNDLFSLLPPNIGRNLSKYSCVAFYTIFDFL